ncbi:unnamed protein product [Adineta steineri]|uniref:Uncharacterized protein n=1 Tax=Adineta steineri TaxID=433720 RepID=A0A819KUT6_9BILA|nr:unnamed protein product [Adineta steineri]
MSENMLSQIVDKGKSLTSLIFNQSKNVGNLTLTAANSAKTKWNESSTTTKACIIGSTAAVTAPLAILPVLGLAGFTSAGVAAGSIAASMQTAATASGGIFALCQSAGAVGAVATSTSVGVGLAASATAGGVTAVLQAIGVEEQSKTRQIWPLFSNAETLLNAYNPAEETSGDDQLENLPRLAVRTSFQYADTEQIISDDPQHNQSREKRNIIAQIFSCFGRRRSIRKYIYNLSWRSLFGTMFDIEKTYLCTNFLNNYKCIRFIIILIDSVLRGIGQVMFANNPLSGLIILIGLFIGNWELSLYGLLGTTVSTLTGHLFEFDYSSIRSGLYGYNGCLVGMGIAYFSFPQSPQIVVPVIIMSIFSTIFFAALGKTLVQHFSLPLFTFSFQISTWIWLLGALKYRYFFINGSILSPALLTTLNEKPPYSNISYGNYSIEDNFIGFFASIAQVYFIGNPYTGAVILVGICICSRILSFFALFGAVTGQLIAAYLLGLPATTIHSGLWGYNSVLTCQALGGMFLIPHGHQIWLFTFYGSMITVVVQAAVSAFLAPTGMPTLTFPFTLICWIYCLLGGSKNLISVKLTAISIPEDHYRRFRIIRLIKTQLKFISHLTNLSSSLNEDTTLEEFLKLNQILPILMCSYANENDLNDIKMLIKQKINIQLTDHNGRSPLHISACQGNMNISKWLIKYGKVDVNIIDKFGGTPLYDAFTNGHFQLTSFLFLHGAQMPQYKSKELAFYLNAFVYERNLEGIKLLISCGFNPNIADYEGRNPLHIAVMENNVDIVHYLVEHTSIDLNLVDQFKQTAIEYASHSSDMIIFNYLRNKKDSNISRRESIPLDIVTETNLNDQTQTNNTEILSMNIERNCLPALLYQSAVEGDMKIMSKFLEQFPNLNALECLDYDQRSIAHFAATQGKIDIIYFLHKYCSTDQFKQLMNRQDRWGLSPIDEAYRHQHFNISTYFKEHLFDQNNQTERGMTHRSNTESETNDIVHLLQKWKKIFLFSTLAASGQAQRIDALFSRGYFIPTELYTDYDGRTPMHLAAAYGHLNVVQLLIQFGYNEKTQIDRWGNTPLDQAEQMKFKQIIDELNQSQL